MKKPNIYNSIILLAHDFTKKKFLVPIYPQWLCMECFQDTTIGSGRDTFYTEILCGKVVLWCFFTSEMSEKNPQFNFSRLKNVIFFKWDAKVTKLSHLLFHRIWKSNFLYPLLLLLLVGIWEYDYHTAKPCDNIFICP